MSYGCSDHGDASGFRGCGREFGSLAAFDRHWTTVGRADDTDRDRVVVTIDGTRCASDPELRQRGMDVDPRGVWRDVPEADRVRTARANGSFQPRRRPSQAPSASSPHITPGKVVETS
jgi:hypothetical protein